MGLIYSGLEVLCGVCVLLPSRVATGSSHTKLQSLGRSPLISLLQSLMASAVEVDHGVELLKQQQAHVTRELKLAQQRLRREAPKTHVAQELEKGGRDETCPKVDQRHSKMLLLLFELANVCVDVVVSYVLGQGRPEHFRSHGLDVWNSDTRRCISTGVELLYLGVSYSLVVGLFETEDNVMYELCKYVVEYNLFHWLVKQNCEKGVFPKSDQIFTAACSYLPAGAPLHIQERLKSFFLGGDRAARYWLAAFKDRWGVTTGLPPSGEDLEPSVLQSKVPWQGYLSLFLVQLFGFFEQCRGLVLGSVYGPRSGPPAKVVNKRGTTFRSLAQGQN